MTEKKDQEPAFQVKHRIINILLVKFDVSTSIKSLSKDEKDKIAFGVGLKFLVDLPTKTVKVEANIRVLSEDSANPKLIAEMDTLGIFEVQNMEEVLNKHSNTFPTSVIVMFSSILISTSRGFFILKSANTVLEGVMMPPIDVARLFQIPIQKEPK